MKTARTRMTHGTAAAAMALLAASMLAEAYPTKPIRLIVPFPPAGTTDIVARAIADKMSTHLGQQLVIDNRIGAAGVIGTQLLALATPDGHTLGMATVSTMAAVPAMNPKVPYSPTADFTPIINVAATPNVLVVHPSFPARDYKAFVAELRRRPDHYSFASSGEGGLGHMLMVLFQSKTSTSLLHIPYSGGNPAVLSVLGGHVPLMIANLPTVLQHIQNKRLVAIAVAADARTAATLEVPTFEQLRVPEVNRLAFYGICGPKGLPQAIVGKLHAVGMQSLADPQVVRKIEDTGSVIIGNSPREFRNQINAELAAYKQVYQMQKARP